MSKVGLDNLNVTIKRMWLEGRSAGQIALQLHGVLSRDAVLGRVRRMGLSRGKPTIVTSQPVRPRPAREYYRMPPVLTVWSMPAEKQRDVFARKAAEGARKALEAMGL